MENHLEQNLSTENISPDSSTPLPTEAAFFNAPNFPTVNGGLINATQLQTNFQNQVANTTAEFSGYTPQPVGIPNQFPQGANTYTQQTNQIPSSYTQQAQGAQVFNVTTQQGFTSQGNTLQGLNQIPKTTPEINTQAFSNQAPQATNNQVSTAPGVTIATFEPIISATPEVTTQVPVIDYSFISSPARIAIYDNLQSAPRVIQIPGAPAHEYIEHIASLTYQNANALGGMIPYTVIREVSENFIHANFNEVVVSILDRGNTIRFSDQGPGIHQKELVQLPGFTSATEPMKQFIRGVGSGLPIVKDYLNISHGNISIEDNVNQGSVVTISLISKPSTPETFTEIPELTSNETIILKALLPNQNLGVSDVNKITNIPVGSIHNAFSKLEEKGLVQKINKKRSLTETGHQVALTL